MYVRHLSVVDFRSWPTAELDLEPGPSVLIGANGQGKTNLVEALAYLATLGSHRVAADAPLIRAGADRALVRAAAVADGRELRVEIEIVPGRANRARLNGSPVTRPRDILGAVRTVVFAPEDLAIVRGDPSERRTFLDELVVARSPRMAGVRSDYERVLKQRSVLLKSAAGARGSRSIDLPTLDVWDGHLAAFGAQLLRARLDAVTVLRPFAVSVYGEVAPTSAELTLRYASALPELAEGDGGGLDVPALETALLAELVRRRPQELDRGVNLVGPHRDDLEIGIGALPVRGYASHGEGWSVALALRLAAFELLRTEYGPGGEPILILDDVFAELDADRRAQLAMAAGKAEQVLITAAVGSDVPDQLAGDRFVVSGGCVRRMK